MRSRLIAGLLLCGLSSLHQICAQAVDPNLMREVAAVRQEMARSNLALRQYTWTEHTEVLVKGSVKSSTAFTCRYDESGQLIRNPIGEPKDRELSKAVSRRPMVRKKSEMQDYMERAVTLIQNYVPVKPDQIQYLLQTGEASLGPSEGGKSELRFTHYFQAGDVLVFTYDSATKALLRASIKANLANPKDPVTLEAAFATLPEGVTHLSSATLTAKAKKIQVNRRNVMYQKPGE